MGDKAYRKRLAVGVKDCGAIFPLPAPGTEIAIEGQRGAADIDHDSDDFEDHDVIVSNALVPAEALAEMLSENDSDEFEATSVEVGPPLRIASQALLFEYVWSMSGVCLAYVWEVLGSCTLGFAMRIPGNTNPKTFQTYAKHTPDIHQTHSIQALDDVPPEVQQLLDLRDRYLQLGLPTSISGVNVSIESRLLFGSNRYVRLRVQCANPDHVSCSVSRSLRFSETLGLAEPFGYLGVWLSAQSANKSAHVGFKPSVNQIRDWLAKN